MTAQLRTDSAAIVLLIEPKRPGPRTRCTVGWERKTYYDRDEHRVLKRLVRRYADDAEGARLQRMIVRFVLGGEKRSALAAERGMSETNCQYALRGKTWVPYTRPVLDALRRLGVSAGRGKRCNGHERLHEIIAAQHDVIRRLATPARHEQALADARLLLAATEGL